MESQDRARRLEHHRTQVPSWRRPGLYKRGSDAVKTLQRDKFQPLSPLAHHASSAGGPCSAASDEAGDSSSELQHSHKVTQLEKNIVFLKQQHRETLQQLHKEIERLKKENRELNFKLIMCRCGHSGGGKTKAAANRRRTLLKNSLSGEDTNPGTPNDELHTIFLEQEVRDLRNSLAAEKSKNNRLMRVIERKVLEKQKSIDQSDNESTSGCVAHTPGGSKPSTFRGASRPPTLEECEAVIKQLQMANNQQSHELVQIKADLRDVLYSHKWTPDAYLMARAYVHDEKYTDVSGLPQLTLPQHSKQMVERAYQRVKEEVSLPPLRPTIANIAHRHKRSQAIKDRGFVGR